MNDEYNAIHDILGLQVQLKYAHQMSFMGYLNSNDCMSDWTNNDACYFTWSRDQTHVNSQSSSSCLNTCSAYKYNHDIVCVHIYTYNQLITLIILKNFSYQICLYKLQAVSHKSFNLRK